MFSMNLYNSNCLLQMFKSCMDLPYRKLHNMLAIVGARFLFIPFFYWAWYSIKIALITFSLLRCHICSWMETGLFSISTDCLWPMINDGISMSGKLILSMVLYFSDCPMVIFVHAFFFTILSVLFRWLCWNLQVISY